MIGDDFDHRVDVFATGVVAWELLSGRRLFAGTHDAQVLHALLYAPVPALDASVPAEVAAVVMRALDRDPARRWSSCSAFSEALEAAARTGGGVATSRAVAAFTSRFDPRNAERGRASYLSLPRVDVDDREGRMSGVVRRRSEAPECSYDALESVEDSGEFEVSDELDEILVDEYRAEPEARDDTDFILENVIIRRASWGGARALWFCVALSVVVAILWTAIRLTPDRASRPATASSPRAAASRPAPPPVPLRENTVARRAAPRGAIVPAAPRVTVAPARPVVRPAAATAWANVPLLGVGRDAAGRPVLR
ncbi:MAG: hypothetical protein U0326_23585 [Polyangiales bacterium]